MAAIVFLLTAFILGYALTKSIFPKVSGFVRGTSEYFLLIPMWFYLGIIPITWAVYILAVLLVDKVKGNVLLPANAIAIGTSLVISALLLFLSSRKEKALAKSEKAAEEESLKEKAGKGASGKNSKGKGREGLRAAQDIGNKNSKNNKGSKDNTNVKKDRYARLTSAEMVFFILAAALIIFLMVESFHIKDGKIYVGLSVFSDFSPHLSMIRSFSRGTNFPAQYTPYAGSDIKYHFMFEFLAGNLEFLGLRLDYAFNVPSILGMLSTISLIYVFALKLSYRKLAGGLAVLFFLFRSSPSAFTYLASAPKGNVKNTLLETMEFIGYTPNENWGLWNLNVYLNQRHLGFSLGVMILFVMFFTERFLEGAARLKERTSIANGGTLDLEKGFGGFFTALTKRISVFVKDSLFSLAGWKIRDKQFYGEGKGIVKRLSLGIIAGLYLGMLGFWNGAVVIAALLVLFMLAAAGDGRLEYLVTAIISVGLVLLQSHTFIEDSPFGIKYQFGFIAENKTFFGVLDYIWLLTGAALIVMFAAFVTQKGSRKYLILAYFIPFVFAFNVSMTIDVTVNHKYIMMSLMLLSVVEGEFIAEMFSKTKSLAKKAAYVLLVFVLIFTGAFEAKIIANRNEDKITEASGLTFDVDDPVTKWLIENTDSDDILLTSNYCMNNVILAGPSLYLQWPYYAWSAGYDTDYRAEQVKLMYSASNVSELKELVHENDISYIIVDSDNRMSEDYELNEDTIAEAFELVFHDDNRFLNIYKVD